MIASSSNVVTVKVCSTSDDKEQRTGFVFLDMQDASQIPAIAEPWFLAFNSQVEIHPVMVPDDLTKAGKAIEQAVKKYG